MTSVDVIPVKSPNDKKLYKHMIFTDVGSSNYGAKLLASAFVADGYIPAFTNKLGLKSDETLKETKNNNFGLLISKSYGKKSMSTKFKKAEMLKYNERPSNVNGSLIRFIILDQGFKEGIDLFDVKYVHLFEPLVSRADEKQAIGRSTRFCGQKGLQFHPRFGWPLYVYRYDLTVTRTSSLYQGSKTLFDLYLKYSNIDMSRVVFAAELEKASIDAAVDKSLTTEVHSFKIDYPVTQVSSNQSGGNHKDLTPPRNIMNMASMQSYVSTNFSKFKYPKVKLENMCGGGGPLKVTFTPTQDFVRHFFQPSSAYKGMLLYHSVGTGKTCTAIATATTSFEKEGYSILWVTRHTLKTDIWKNMYNQVCSIDVQDRLDSGKLKIPKSGIKGGPMTYVSDKWIEPMSYKQFSNMLLKKNRFYDTIVKRNGEDDPLKNTLVIIDEAHKLYAENVAASERPRVDILEKMIQNSYEVSGEDSARVLLMTATPYTTDGMEMIKLLNLLKPKDEHFPNDFDEFAEDYLTDDGTFTKRGLSKYQNSVSGYISYLNRSQDARNFAHPVIENVLVPMSLTLKEKPAKHLDKEVKDIAQKIRDLKNDIRVEKKSLQENIRENRSKCMVSQKQKVGACNESVKASYKTSFDAAKSRKTTGMNTCKDLAKTEKKPCRDGITLDYNNRVEILKTKKTEGLEKCKDVKKACTNDKTTLLASLNKKVLELDELVETEKSNKNEKKQFLKDYQVKNKKYNEDMKEARMNAKVLRDELKVLNVRVKELKEELKNHEIEDKEPIKDEILDLLEEIKDVKENHLDPLKAKLTNLASDKKIASIRVGRGVIGDVSQETALAKKCFN